MIAQVLTRKELAERCGVTRMALNNWEREGAPVAAALEWPLDDAFKLIDEWRRANKRPRYFGDTEPDADGTLQERLLAAQIREKNAAALAKELKNAETSGRLVDRDEIVGEFADWLSHAKPIMEALPDDIAKESPEAIRVMAQRLARNAVERMFRKLAAWKPQGENDA